MAGAELAAIAEWIRSSQSIVILTGAGISTESGIPDFRGPQGVWTKDPKSERLSDINVYMTSPEVRVEAWQARLNSPVWSAEPNAGHIALAQLGEKASVDCLITQNIDGLHLKAGTSADNLIEIHGTAHTVVCMNCDERAPMERALARVRAGEQDPPCRSCGGILKSATISFGQPLVAEELAMAEAAAERCDLFIAVGTTLVVYPVANLPAVALRRGARLIIFNAEPTPYDSYSDAVMSDTLGDVLPELVDLV